MDNYYQQNSTSGSDPRDMGFWEVLNLPVGVACAELLRRGIRTIHSIKQTTRDIFQEISDEEYAKLCLPVLTLNQCVKWVKAQLADYPQAAYLFIYCEENRSPRNANDLFSVAVAIVDAQKRAIPVKSAKGSRLFPKEHSDVGNDDIVCMVIPTRTLDEKLIKALDGNPSVLIKL